MMKKMHMPSEEEMQEMFAISVVKQKITNSVDSVLQNSGMIIAASLSVIIFLLSFTENRTVILEIGLSFFKLKVKERFKYRYYLLFC